jgi:hypothetical protein
MMTRPPDLATIHAAERRTAQSRRNTLDGAKRTRQAVLSKLKRPSTMVLLAGAAGLGGYLLMRRPRQQASALPDHQKGATTKSAKGIARILVARYAMYGLNYLRQQVLSSWHKGLHHSTEVPLHEPQ